MISTAEFFATAKEIVKVANFADTKAIDKANALLERAREADLAGKDSECRQLLRWAIDTAKGINTEFDEWWNTLPWPHGEPTHSADFRIVKTPYHPVRYEDARAIYERFNQTTSNTNT